MSEDHNPIKGLRMENVQVKMEQKSKWEGGTMDLRPPKENLYMDIKYAGFTLENVPGAILNHCLVEWGNEKPPSWFGSALSAKKCPEIVIHNFQGKSAHPNLPDLDLDDTIK